jgi:hypothetical protein
VQLPDGTASRVNPAMVRNFALARRLHWRRGMKLSISLAAIALTSCTASVEIFCYDDDDLPTACEVMPDEPEVPANAIAYEPPEGQDGPDDYLFGPDDLDGTANEALVLALADDAETASEAVTSIAATGGRTDIAAGRTNTAERRKLLPIGRSAGTRRYVIMRLTPADLPNLATGDVLRAAAEIQVTTACDIGQTGPMCGYTPNVRMQLLLTGDPEATDAHGAGTLALSDVKKFSCNANDHHCVEIINFAAASKTLNAANAPGCVADQSCYVNLVVWAYNNDARGDGKDKLIMGANEGDFIHNGGKTEQDRGRVMLVRERGITAADKTLRVTKHNVKSGGITFGSNGDEHRVYSHTLAGGADLRAGDKFRVWAEMNVTSDHRVNADITLWATKNRADRNGGSVDALAPGQISEHNGTNCSPGNPCHLRKVAVFEVKQDVKGPVYINVASSAEVPGPGFANVTVHDDGFVKSVHYKR